jgi:hypothetical protein
MLFFSEIHRKNSLKHQEEESFVPSKNSVFRFENIYTKRENVLLMYF